MFLTRVSVAHPVFATMMTVVVLVFGAFSYESLGVDAFPKIDVPAIAVTTTYPGATPDTVAAEVSRPVEEALHTISGLDEVTSTSYEGRSVVVATFKLEVQSGVAAQEVRDKVAALQAELPSLAERPIVSRFNPSDEPILSIAISSASLDVAELTRITEQQLQRQLTVVSGVGQVTLAGGQKRQIDINIDEMRLRSLGLGINEVIHAVTTTNQNWSAGSVISDFSERSIQVRGRIDDPEGFLTMIVARRGGAPVYLRDIASVKIGSADAESLAFDNGQAALAIDIVKVQDANTVQVVKDVRKRLDQLSALLVTQDVHVRIVKDDSLPIAESLNEVQWTLIEGATLAVVIVFLFLNSWRSTVITGLTLPIAIIGTLAVINVLGFTLNILTLLALTLSIGILIDDAIVVRENITRHLRMGKSHNRAALDGTNEIGLAVMATTATIVAVFLPVAFMDGMMGRFMYEFGVTVSAAVLISLFVAFTLDPMLSSVWQDPDAMPEVTRGPVGRIVARFDHGFKTLVRLYRDVLRWTLAHRLITLVMASSIFAASLLTVPLVGVEFVPMTDEGRFRVHITTPAASSLDYTSTKVKQVETALREFPEVASTYSTINTGATIGKHRAAVLVTLVPLNQRERTPYALADPIRHRLSIIPGIKIAVIQEGLGGGESPIQLSILGDDQKILERLSGELVVNMRRISGLVDITSSASEQKSIISVQLKSEYASDLGISLPDLASMISPLVGGEDISTWTNEIGESFDVVVRLPADKRASTSALGELMVAIPNAKVTDRPMMVRLDQVADINVVETASEIRRLDMSREILISADSSGRSADDVTAELETLIARSELPAGYRIQFGGETEDIQEASDNMLKALIMAVIFIYVVLASQFGSFTQPIAIMATMPLSLAGVVLALLVTGSTINLFSMIGFIMLMGLVTKNGILLVDFANNERRRGLSMNEALENAGAVRFRPIVMTTLAMIFGMIPLALASAGGGAQRAPMAHAVIGGLISSTLLTLIVVPVIFSSVEALLSRRPQAKQERNPLDNKPFWLEDAQND
jgi:HAE1 family hydrophobic/amphiphilic exporter-1